MHTVVDPHKRYVSSQFVDILTALAMKNNNSSVKSLVFSDFYRCYRNVKIC